VNDGRRIIDVAAIEGTVVVRLDLGFVYTLFLELFLSCLDTPIPSFLHVELPLDFGGRPTGFCKFRDAFKERIA